MNNVAAKVPSAEAVRGQRRLPWGLGFFVRLVRDKPLGLVGGVLVLLMALLAVFAEAIAPYGFNEVHLADRFQSYSWRYLLGADDLGRDVLSRVIYGARSSMYVGLGAVLLGTVAATAIGIVSGYFGGVLDVVVQRIVDAWMSFPWLVIMLAMMAVLGPGLLNVILVLAILFTFQNSRIVRSATLSVKEGDYVTAARALGCSDLRIIVSHILPNIMAPIIIVASLGLGNIILAEASLSFLGYGVPPPHPSWGGMLAAPGMAHMLRAPWMAIWPGVALSLAVFGFNMWGDAVRDLLDPRLRGTSGRFR